MTAPVSAATGAAPPLAQARWRWLAWGALVYAFGLRLLLGARIELMPEEAYYWNYSRHLDIGYLDHPPMVAWLIRLATGTFGQNEFAIRAAAAACAAVAAVYLYRLTRELCGATGAWFVLAVAQAMPFYFAAGFVMTPDAPLTAAWAAATYFLYRALVAGEARAWTGAGIALGLGLLSKYTIALLGAAAAVFMLVDPQARRWWRRPQPYAAALLALLIFAPVIVWNARHGWASFSFQTAHRLAEAPKFTLPRLVAALLVLLTPTGVVAIAAMLGPPGRRAAEALPASAQRGRAWLFWATTLPLAVFTVFSLRHEVKLDWMGAPSVPALPLLGLGAVAAAHAGAKLRPWLRGAWWPTMLVMAGVFGLGLWHLAVGLPGLSYGRQPELVPVGWRQLGADVHLLAGGYARAHGREPLIVGMDRYATASELAFYGSGPDRSVLNVSSAHLLGGMGLMYEQWFPRQAQEGRDALLVAWDPAALEAPGVAQHFATLAPVERGELRRGVTPVRPYFYRFAAGYRCGVTCSSGPR